MIGTFFTVPRDTDVVMPKDEAALFCGPVDFPPTIVWSLIVGCSLLVIAAVVANFI